MEFKFNYTRLIVKDYKACCAFYRDVLGLEATFTSEVDSYVELTNGNVKLTLLDQEQMTGHFGHEANMSFGAKDDSIALSFRVNDVEEAHEYLQKKGVEIASKPWNFADWGIKAALFRDPDGNLIELTQMGEMVGADQG